MLVPWRFGGVKLGLAPACGIAARPAAGVRAPMLARPRGLDVAEAQAGSQAAREAKAIVDELRGFRALRGASPIEPRYTCWRESGPTRSCRTAALVHRYGRRGACGPGRVARFRPFNHLVEPPSHHCPDLNATAR